MPIPRWSACKFRRRGWSCSDPCCCLCLARGSYLDVTLETQTVQEGRSAVMCPLPSMINIMWRKDERERKAGKTREGRGKGEGEWESKCRRQSEGDKESERARERESEREMERESERERERERWRWDWRREREREIYIYMAVTSIGGRKNGPNLKESPVL